MCGLLFLSASRPQSIPLVSVDDIRDAPDQYRSQRVTVYGLWEFRGWNITAVTGTESEGSAIPSSNRIRLVCRGLLAERTYCYATIGRAQVAYFTGWICPASSGEYIADLCDIESVVAVTEARTVVINPFFCNAPRPEELNWCYTPLSEWESNDNLPPYELRENLIRSAYDIRRLIAE